MVEKLKVGLRIMVLLPVLVLLLLVVIAVGIPFLIGFSISMGVHLLFKNTIGKLSPTVQANHFVEVLCLLILSPILATACVFYIPAVIASLPVIAYFCITEYLAGRWLEKHGFVPQNS